MTERFGTFGIQPEIPGLEAHEQDVSVNLSLPYSDLTNIWIPEKSLYENALRTLPLGRLGNIKQLSFLSYIGPDPKITYFFPYSHDRLDHSLTVGLVAEKMLRQNRLPEDQINLGILAGFLHDIATPAHGDPIKYLDPEALNEETYWFEALDEKSKNFLEQFGATKEVMDGIISNQGVLGKVLDIADRITYTMKDLQAIRVDTRSPTINLNPYLIFINLILSHNPKIGNIYQEVGIDEKKQEVFFNNPQALATFLLLRAHLHQNLYLYPTNQGRDLFITQLIKPFYSRDGNSELNPQNLRQMDDFTLMNSLFHHYKSLLSHDEFAYSDLVNWHPEFERFDTVEDARKREEELRKNENIAVVGIKECKGFDPATSYKVANGYKYVEFRDFDPHASRQIEAIAESTKGIFLFWADVSEDSPTNNLLKAVLQKQ